MKKIKLEGKLNLNKTNISNLNEDEMNEVQGGGFLSIGKKCTSPIKCENTNFTCGIFCLKK